MEGNSGNLPSLIVIWRDGVGEGQLDHVLNTEVIQTEVKLKKIIIWKRVDQEDLR